MKRNEVLNMLTRIITGVIGIALAAFVIQTGGTLFAVAGLVLAVGAWFEYCRAFQQKGLNMSLCLGGCMIAFLWSAGWLGSSQYLVGAVALAVLAILLKTVFCHKSFKVPEACASAAGVLYIGLSFVHLVMLRFVGGDSVIATSVGNFQTGCALIWVCLIGTWASDTFAYFAGFFLGKHKLCPEISPKKTIEGFVGGVVGTTASVAGLGVLFGFSISLMALLGFCICIVATLGDLVESVMKRYTGIKDSGNIIPGHGGIWDRFDSVIYTAPFVYYFVLLAGLAG